MWLLGAGTNAGMQYADSGEINPVNSVAAGWINVITMGQGWKGTIAWNAAGGALTKPMQGHANVESIQVYTQVSVRALQAVHVNTHPAERGSPDDITEYVDHNGNTDDTTCGDDNEQYHPLQNR
ncbi:TPA: hypothetical protein ACJGLG_004866 [Salmonella enterica subsp. enterica serovar Typhimurium]